MLMEQFLEFPVVVSSLRNDEKVHSIKGSLQQLVYIYQIYQQENLIKYIRNNALDKQYNSFKNFLHSLEDELEVIFIHMI